MIDGSWFIDHRSWIMDHSWWGGNCFSDIRSSRPSLTIKFAAMNYEP